MTKSRAATILDTDEATGSALAMVPINRISPAADNLRRTTIVDVAFDELVDSVRSLGIIQPLLLKPAVDGDSVTAGHHYLVVAGHRRLEAARLAGLTNIPALIRVMTEPERQQSMIVENLRRKDLDPIEEATGYERLTTLGLTQRQIADAVGTTQSQIAKRLALRRLPTPIQDAVSNHNITLAVAQEIAVQPPAVVNELTKLAVKTKAITLHEIGDAERTVRRNESRATAQAAGLPEWVDQVHGYNRVTADTQTTATHYKIDYAGALIWITGTPKGAPEPDRPESAKAIRAAEQANQERAAREADQAARRQHRFTIAAQHIDEFLDIAIDLYHIGELWPLGQAGLLDADVQHLFTIAGLTHQDSDDTDPWDTWTDIALNATRPQRTRCFTAAAIIQLDPDPEHPHWDTWKNLYLTRLTTFGYEPDEPEQAAIDRAENLARNRDDDPIQLADELTCSTIDEAQTEWMEPELQQAEPATGEPTLAGAARAAASIRQGVVDLRTRIAHEPDNFERQKLQGMLDHLLGNNPDLDDFYDMLDDPDATLIDPDVDRLGVEEMPACQTCGVEALDGIIQNGEPICNDCLDNQPDEDDIRHAALNTQRPIVDDDGEPIITPTQDQIAAYEAGGSVPPERPWSTYRIATTRKLVDTIAKIGEFDELRGISALEAAVAYERWHTAHGIPLDDTERVEIALWARINELAAAG